MTIDVHIKDVVTAISNLSITGVTVADLDEVPATVKGSTPLFAPNVSHEQGFLSDLTFRRVSYGDDTQAKMDLEYNLNYRYFHSVIGSGEGLLDSLDAAVQKIVLILEVVLANSTLNGAVDVTLNNIPRIGAVGDAAGVLSYHGADIQLHVKEFAQ